MNFLSFFQPSNLILNRAYGIVNRVEELENLFRSYSDIELKRKTQNYLKRISFGESIEDVLPEALATVREACYRVHGMFAYRTQLVSALVIYEGNFAEMKTGEGKTLTIALAAYVASLEQKGVHVVTVNDYLVKRDAEFCRKILNFLGITVGFITTNLSKEIKQQMYACGVTYVTNSELAFDYLRDNMVYYENDILIPRLNFAIIDEGDSILIDEARTPLIISGAAEKSQRDYIEVDLAVKQLKKEDYHIDEEQKTIALKGTGILKMEKAFKVPKLYVFENSYLIHQIQNALIANFIFENGKEYIVDERNKSDPKIILVDYYTGRLLYGQTYNAGLHQAIQAKEYIKINPENQIIASTTYQSFFRLYKKISAISGTAMPESQEFSETYNMIVVKIPTHRPIIRKDLPDIIFGTKETKIKGIIDEIKRHYIRGQPVLVGTSSVYESEIIYERLISQNVPCKILNAKNHKEEGAIISKAGKKHSITIATNIAGRGVDIKINDEVRKLGGLFVLGTDKNESRRIDNQLRGRSGRQGDPGKSIFFISLEDDIFKRYCGDRFEKLSKKMKDEFFDSKFISKTLSNIQKKIQSINFDARKNLIEYNEILSKQQQLIYKQRYFLLTNKNNHEILKQVANKIVKKILQNFIDSGELKKLNIKELTYFLNDHFFFFPLLQESDLKNKNYDEIEKFISNLFKASLNFKKQKFDADKYLKISRRIFLRSIDKAWQIHLNYVSKLRNNVYFYALEQKSPLNVFIEKIGDSFEEILVDCGKEVIQKILNIPDSSIEEECQKYLFEIRLNNSKIASPQLMRIKTTSKNEVIVDTKKKKKNKYQHIEKLIENSHKFSTENKQKISINKYFF